MSLEDNLLNLGQSLQNQAATLVSKEHDTRALYNNAMAKIMLDLSQTIKKLVDPVKQQQNACPYCHAPWQEINGDSTVIAKLVPHRPRMILTTRMDNDYEQKYVGVAPCLYCPACGRYLGDEGKRD